MPVVGNEGLGAIKSWIQSKFAALVHTHTASQITDFATEMAKKADKAHTHVTSDVTGLDAALAGKANATHTHTSADVSDFDNKVNAAVKEATANLYRAKGSCTWAELIAKTDAVIGDCYNVTDKDGMNYVCKVAATAGEDSWDPLGSTVTVDLSDYYTKEQVDAIKEALENEMTVLNTTLGNKADKATTLSGYGITDAYTKTETDTKVDTKADKATTLAGYGISDAYTRTEVETKVNAKANSADVYTKSETYSRTEVDGKIPQEMTAEEVLAILNGTTV